MYVFLSLLLVFGFSLDFNCEQKSLGHLCNLTDYLCFTTEI